MKIKVEKPTRQDIAALRNCPTWSKEPSVFEWQYDATEICYLQEGDMRVVTENGQTVEFAAGDMVTFPAGVKCTWDVRKTVHKHYRFE
jgi:uncharacterized protein